MSNSSDSNNRDLVSGQLLDDEITSLQAQISSLQAQRKLQASAILSSQATKATLLRLQKSQQKFSSQSRESSSQSTPSDIPSDTNPLLTASKGQLLHNQQNLYRACGSITAFRIRDPDPNAVDNGTILGIRIDVSTSGKFITPYYVMLNKPFPNSQLLRVHRHTLPPYIPLAELAQRHLPTGKGAVAMSTSKTDGAKRQDLKRFVRALRKEVVAYHNRVTAIKGLRKEFKLDEKVSAKGKGREKILEDISAADAEAKQVSLRWVDGKVGRVVVDDGGAVVGCVIMGPEGRDRETERAVLKGKMEDIGEGLRAGIY
ncbi:hypothetical protein HYFRA_00005605 [Hymenoscyphus fraxineus]|uniref:Cenp-O kinetochore centromere component n=1 Tax=Hymenoscyphus fraxineus TaxID=746836 RepID=A0A9N9PM13_9HELO|nr:hypothetical protein HYFRA_00005605 [Hymenoscyphus fraxineus]